MGTFASTTLKQTETHRRKKTLTTKYLSQPLRADMGVSDTGSSVLCQKMAFIAVSEYARSTKTEITLLVATAITSLIQAEIKAVDIRDLFQSQILRKPRCRLKDITIVENQLENTGVY